MSPSMSLNRFWFCLSLVVCSLVLSCKEAKQPPTSDIVKTPEQLLEKTEDYIKKNIHYAVVHNGLIGDSTFLFYAELEQAIYKEKDYSALWSRDERWKPAGDSLIRFIREAKLYGLYPKHYHLAFLDSVDQQFSLDSLGQTSRKDAALWAKADVLLTDAFLHIVKDVKLGRLPQDSITLRKDSVLTDSFYSTKLDTVLRSATITPIIATLEPAHEGYILLKAGIREFLDSVDNRTYTKVPATRDSTFKRLLQLRLFEGGYISYDTTQADSAQLSNAIKKFQKLKKITVDGIAGEGTIRLLNVTDDDRFASIAITLDRYKMLPSKMPERYIWVNLPSFYLRLQDKDSVKVVSKIICGKSKTRTPVLTSSISEIVTYPQWTVPNSIILKEILPGIKRDTAYLAKRGFSLIDSKGDEIDPSTVNWAKYTKGIPYKVVQGSGDANALGILKFNFPNKYAVYLHDTNQRYLFGTPVRTFSHGCVRVQEWEKIANYMIRKDYPELEEDIPSLDSMNAWLERKEKHSIPVKNRLPVFIRYFTSEGSPEGIIFYDDIYGEDRFLRARYYDGK